MKNNLNYLFVPYEQALALKELGFDEPCFAFYLNGKLRLDGKIENCISQKRVNYVYVADCLAPIYSQAFDFLREKYNLHPLKVTTEFHTSFSLKMKFLSFSRLSKSKNHYREAELECLKKLIEIVKE
jgi:hypothetical protein